MNLIYFHHAKGGHSIIKVTETVINSLDDNKVIYNVPSPNANIIGIIQNIVFVIKHRKKSYIHHITGSVHYCILALLGCKSVLTIHDTCGLDNSNLNAIKRIIMEVLWYRLPLKYASKVICISEITKQYVEKYTDRKDIIVIHDAIDTKLKFSKPAPFSAKIKILCIGTRENKNLVRTFAALKGLPCVVTIVGILTDEQRVCLKDNNIEYRNLINISDGALNIEYENTDIVSFISLFEGFGMPLIEANQAGRPVIASNIPVLLEVGYNAAHYVDPLSIESIRKGFIELINNTQLREQLVLNGRENVKRFNVNNIKKQWIEVYKSLL